MAVKKKKAKKGKYDYKKIAGETRKGVKDSSERKGLGGNSIYKSDVRFTKFSPIADEDHTIDIIPFQAGPDMGVDLEKHKKMAKEGQWFHTFEYWQHRGIGPLENQTVICPERTWETPCPICEHRRELMAEKAFDDEKMGNLYAKRRNCYNVVCYDSDKEEEKGVQLMDVSFFYFEKHIAKLASKPTRRKRGSKLKEIDPFKNFADPSGDGVSIEWSIEGAKSKKDFDTWMGHQLIGREYDLDEALLDAALQLDQIVEKLTYAELYEKYYDEKYSEEGEEEDEEVEGEEEDEEVEGEEEEEEVEEEGNEDDLDTFDRSELKQILKDQEIDFKVYKSTEDDEIREAIRAARSEEKEEEEEEEEEEEATPPPKSRKRPSAAAKKEKSSGKKKKVSCPQGGTFGASFEDYDECDDCKVWNPCEELFQDKYQEKDDD